MIPRTREEAEDLAETIIQEIVAGFDAEPNKFMKHRNAAECPVRFYVNSPTLENLPHLVLDNLTGNFNRLLVPPLKRSYQIQAYPIIMGETYTGSVQVRADMGDAD